MSGRPSRSRGFTLIELMIALTAGLILLMWMTQLSGMVMRTYQDEARSYSTESTVRVAAERLRSDLQAAGYMSTANLYSDPLFARATTTANPGSQWGAFPALRDLSSIQVSVGGSNTGAVAAWSALAANSLTPDSIRVAGNLTTADEYIGYVINTQLVSSAGGAVCNRGVQVRLSNDDPAVLRLKGSGTTTAAILDSAKKAFLPTYAAAINGGIDAVTGKTYIARLVEPTGKYSNFAPVCDVEYDGTSLFVDLAGPAAGGTGDSDAVVTALAAGGVGGVSGFAPVTINPVQIVEWKIRAGNDTSTNSVNVDAYDPRFELVRQYVDLNGNVLGNPEVIADYVVDLKFAFSFTSAPAAGANPVYTDYAWGDTTAAALLDTTLAVRQPQRLRRVRFRIQVRNAIPDSDSTIASPGDGYLYRYDMTASSTAYGNTPAAASATNPARFARVRTFTSDVALVNQTRLW